MSILHSRYKFRMSAYSVSMKRAVAEIKIIDPSFSAIIDSSPLCTIGKTPSEKSNFESLVASVTSQQLATKAAEKIHGRLLGLAGPKITPLGISKLTSEELRSVGLSGAKVKTIQGLASADISGEVTINELHLVADDELIANSLTALWGIGPWTVDMFLIFQLGRKDIWPVGDLGVRKGWGKIHDLTPSPDSKALLPMGEVLRPYRSIVAWYCWRALDNKE